MAGAEDRKRAAAQRALELVRPGMVLGLGTGSTARYFIEGLRGKDVRGVPTSAAAAALARSVGVQVVEDLDGPIDLAVDGADEIDPSLSLIKGRGGALFREKLVAATARRFVVVADESKLVDRLGIGVLPVEVLTFLWRTTAERLEKLGAEWRVRGGEGAPYLTDNGNLILDLTFVRGVSDPASLAAALKGVTGVVEHGLFIGLASGCIVAGAGGVRILGSVD